MYIDIMLIYKNTKSETLEIKEGYVLSPLPINIFMDKIMKRTNRNIRELVLDSEICKEH